MTSAEPLPASWVKTLYRGDTREWTELIEENTGTTLAPVWTAKDLSGYTMRAQIRATQDDATVMATITCAFTTDGVDGMLSLTLPASEAVKLVPGKVWADLELTRTSDGFVHTYLAGKWTVRADVSRA